ncbi:hypothetical protein [Roseibium litorale]|uniref:Phage baseplate assembly protein V n=1 Tax=Roseibium litorale TaxID=2803841 RepID=A0ABR9CJ83_9HYPH|nr:hypothetical protein [Roseibium litorale]MBD8890900.1 hypothetical protein [Roseibium litorale]
MLKPAVKRGWSMFDGYHDLQRRVADLEKRIENGVRKVRVKSYEGGKVVVEDDSGFVSAPIPQGSMSAGAWRIDAPAETGTQGLMFSDGDPANGVFVPMLPTQNAGNASTETGTMRLISPAGKVLTIDGDGFALEGDVKIQGRLDVSGAGVTHNGTNIGDDHKHTDVMPGPALTGPPV